MSDFNQPTLSTAYATFLSDLKDRDVSCITLCYADPSNIPAQSMKWHRAGSKLQEYVSSAWEDKVLSLAGGGTASTTAAGARTSLGLGTMAVQDNNNVNITGGTISSAVNLSATGLTSGIIPNARYDTTISITAGIGIGGTSGTDNSLRIYGSTSGYIAHKSPAVAGTNTITWPAGTTDFTATGGTNQVVKQSSTGAAFTVATLAASEIASGAALTRVDDTNITLTLGGSPATSLLASTSLTLGWTGTLAAARLNSNVVQSITNDTNVTGSISAQVLTLSWTGTLAAARLNTNVVQSVVNDTNVTGSISSQTLTLGWTGTLADARLTSNVPLKNAANTFTANQTINAILAYQLSAVFNWQDKSGSVNASVQAPSDGLIIMHLTLAGSGAASILSDASNPPTTYRARWVNGVVGEMNTLITPVKKGDYYLCGASNFSGSFGIDNFIYWCPLGTSG